MDELERIGDPEPSTVDAKGYQSPTGYHATQADFLDLFSLEGKQAWTRAIAVYDLIPKFVFSADCRARVDTYTVRESEVDVNGMRLRVTRTPGQVIQRKKGSVKDTYGRWPGEREELIARALRYLGVHQGVPMSFWQHSKEAPQIRVAFTFHQIISLLAEWGHTLNSREVDEGLQVLLSARIEVAPVESTQRRPLYQGNLISEYYGLDEVDGTRKRIVVLNSLEADAVLKGTHQVLNFFKLMALPSPRTRRLYEMIMIRFRNADRPPDDSGGKIPPPYSFRLSELIDQGIVEPAKELRKTAALVRKSLQDLAEQGVLWPQQPFRERQHKVATKGRAKITDYTWEVWLSKESVADIVNAHQEEAVGKDRVLAQLPPTRRAEIRNRAKANLP
ncbi:MAG: hypothetical protein WA771_02970 [Chthoniobacterales bacterium]